MKKLILLALAPLVMLGAPAEAAIHTTVVMHAGPGHHWRNRRVCTMQWRHHHRVRVCRTVRRRW